jgi:glycosyltransferase involved in cell wall biosynthesis
MDKKLKIFVREDNDHKISHWHIDHWQKEGHEVQWDMYPDWDKVAWSDVSIFFWCDPYAQMLAARADEFPCQKVVQCVDIDAWAGHWGSLDWGKIDDMVFMSKHIKDMVLGHSEPVWEANGVRHPRVHHFPLGIDLKQWKYQDRKQPKKMMGFVAAEWWSAKNPAMVLQLMKKLVDIDPEWHFSWVGKWGPEKWLYEYVWNMIDDLGLREHVHTDFNRQESLDDWWKNIDYFVTFSQKDSFSLIVGEAMAKGIKTFVHNFLGAKNIWDHKYVWSSLDELVEKILKDDYNSREYRTYIKRNHDIRPILKEWDKMLMLGKL